MNEKWFPRFEPWRYLTQIWQSIYDGNKIPERWIRKQGAASEEAQTHAIPANKG